MKTSNLYRSSKTTAMAMLLLYLTIVFANAQTPIAFTYKTYSLEHDDDNVIQNAGSLDGFFESLYQLSILKDRKINIVHIGDSHIQADYLTTIVRRNFQTQFGNAGRGLVIPARVAGTNEPYNVKSNSDIKWIAKRCIYVDQPLPIGIGGITVNTDQPNARLNIYMNDLWIDYTFNSVTLFFQKDLTSFNFAIKDTSDQQVAIITNDLDETSINFSKVVLDKPINAMSIEVIKSNEQQKQATIFGLNLENASNGILYHAIGVNGAKYTHYNAALYFSKQTSVLKPELFIISLGTNESLDYPYIDKKFFSNIDKLVTSLRLNNPGAAFILITPPESFRRKIKSNPGILKIREQIIQYAVENGLAFYDMYRALGGENSAAAWRQAGLLRADGIHFTKDGYEYQGNLLYYALIKSFNQYVPLRHP